MSEKIKELRRVCRSCVSRPRDEHCLLCDIADPAVERQEPATPFDAKRALTQALSAYEAMTGRHLMPAGISEHQDQFICGFLAGAAEQPAPVSVVRKLEMADVVNAHMEIPNCPVMTGNQCHALAMKLNARLDKTNELNQ